MNFRLATAEETDIQGMRKLIFTHAVNEWNYLPETGVSEELEDVRSGRAIAVLVVEDGEIIGLAVGYPSFVRFPDQVDPMADLKAIAYIGDVAIHRDYVGKGLGTRLLTSIREEVVTRGARTVFIDCHEENLASRGMMRKGGFEEVAIVADPERRFVGTRRTCICKWSV